MLVVMLFLAGGRPFVLGLSSIDPDPTLFPIASRAGAKIYLVALPWRLVEPEAMDLKGLTIKEALKDKRALRTYSEGVDWTEADKLILTALKEGLKPIVGVGWGWTDMVPRWEGGVFCPDYVGHERYKAHFALHVRAVVERYDGDGFLDAPGGLVVRRWLPERALNEAIVEAALGKREPSTFSAPYSVWMYWDFLDELLRLGATAVREASKEAEVGILIQTDVPRSVSAYVGKPTWEGALEVWASEADFVVIETFPNAWLPEPLKAERIAEKVKKAEKIVKGKPIFVLTGYPSGPEELGYTEELQARFLREAVKAAREAGAEALLWHTVRSKDEASIKPAPKDVQDLKDIGRFIEAGDIFTIVNMAISEPQRMERFLSIVKTVEDFAGLLRADGSAKPAWAVFSEMAQSS